MQLHHNFYRSRTIKTLFMGMLAGISFIGMYQPVYAQKSKSPNKSTWSLKKERDIIIYSDSNFHAAFPSIIRKKDGEFFLAFRKAPNRALFGEAKTFHVDANSNLVSVTSKDGIHWNSNAKTFYAHDFGGSQDPCLLQLQNGHIICASYGWTFVRKDTKLKEPYGFNNGAAFLGGYIIHSSDDAKSWDGPFYPPHIPQEKNFSPLKGEPLPACNRGEMIQGRDGKVYWSVIANETNGFTSNHLLVSEDEGKTWTYKSQVAKSDTATFNETSLYQTPKGDIVAFMRTANMQDEACIARSTDGGNSFQPWQKMGFKGHPLQALRLPNDQVLLVYGYRHQPYGIRARILNAECTDFATAEEIVIRADGAGTDIGYPWSIMLDDQRVLVTYYFMDKPNGVKYIAGSVLELVKK